MDKDERDGLVIGNLVSMIVGYALSLTIDCACGIPIALAVLLGLCVAGLCVLLTTVSVLWYVERQRSGCSTQARLPPPKQ